MRPEDEPLDFLDQEPEPAAAGGAAWKLLIVDDDVEVHAATRFAINGIRIAGRPLQLLNARSAAEAAAILRTEPEIAVILLDVVMESPNAGLDLVQRIRHELGLGDVRIILRTGQPGHAPELNVIRDYDINDYKTKSELTHTRLVTALIAAIRSYDQLRTISENRRGLEMIVTATPSLMRAKDLESCADEALRLMMSLLHLHGDGAVCVQGGIGDNDGKRPRVIAAAGRAAAAVGRPLEQVDDADLVAAVRECLTRQAHCFAASHTALYLQGGQRQAVMLVRSERTLTAVERQLLEIFAANVLSCFGNVTLVERLNHIAYHDPLTRLPNRTCFIEELNKAGASAAQGRVVCMIDIDRFTDINNALGHAVADQLLIAVGQRLGQACPGCHLARIGADTFGLIGPEQQLAPERLQALLQEPFAAGDQLLPISATIGLCRITGSENGHTLFNRADMAFTRARLNPHGGPLYFSPDMEQHTHWRLEVLRQLRRDFHDGRLAVWFQPQVSLADGGLSGLEALARWPNRRPGGFTQPPGVFIPLAEESGLIVDIGAWILDQSCAAYSRLAAEGHAPRRIAVNVSMPQMRRPDFPERVACTLAARGVPASALELEITESQLLDEPQLVLRNLHALKQEGIQITIDDFGTGYSSLGYLRQLPIDCIKIDRSFVVEIDRGRGDLFAETIITLAHKLGAETVAEGVETAAQVRCLRNLGCDTVQGFLYGRPMPADQLAGWIDQRALH